MVIFVEVKGYYFQMKIVCRGNNKALDIHRNNRKKTKLRILMYSALAFHETDDTVDD